VEVSSVDVDVGAGGGLGLNVIVEAVADVAPEVVVGE